MYEVLVDFTDLQDNQRVYRKGDTYPNKDYSPSVSRIKELSTKDNRLGIVLIKRIKVKE